MPRYRVKLNLDTPIELREIRTVPSEWQVEHQIRALVVAGRTHSLGDLETWQTEQKEDWTKISRSIERACRNKRVFDPKCVKKDNYGGDKSKKRRDSGKPPIYELRADKGQARVMFFYTPDEQEIIVCTNTYWKTGDAKKQTRAFAKARRLRDVYLGATKK